MVDRWPKLALQIRSALIADGEVALAAQVDGLEIVQMCKCGDSFCQSFYTAPKPEGPWGPGHRNVAPEPAWSGMLIFDVVDERITYVEVIDRPPLD